MANHDISFAPGSLIRFGSLDFLATVEGIELIPILVLPARPAILGPAAGIAASGWARARGSFPGGRLFGLRNAAETYGRLLTRSMTVSPASNELAGMVRTISDVGSSNGSPHPSRECLMVDAHSEGSNDNGADGRQRTPPSRAAATAGALPRAPECSQ